MEVFMDGNKISEIKNPGKFESPARFSYGKNDVLNVKIDPNNRIIYKNILLNNEKLFSNLLEYDVDEIW
jgi:hypothetical protein